MRFLTVATERSPYGSWRPVLKGRRIAGQCGHVNDGNWHQVSIPVSAILAAAPNADLSKVTSPFVIADRYEFTGKAQQAAITSKIEVDAIHWAR